MEDLLNKTYLKNIIENKANTIDYYVRQYGKDMQGVFENNFDETKFCIFTNPNSINSYVRRNYSKLAATKALELLKKIGLDENLFEIENLVESYLAPKNIQGKSYLETIFGEKSVFFSIDQNKIFGIWSFASNLNMDLVKKYAKNKDATNYLNSLRISFLKNMGYFNDDLKEQEILNSDDYTKLLKYYNKIIDEFNKELDNIKNLFQNDLKFYNDLLNSYYNSIQTAVRKAIKEILYDELNPQDKKIVDQDEFFDPSILEITSAAFNIEDLEELSHIESFSKENTELLLNPRTKKAIRNKIFTKRVEYLQSVGCDLDYIRKNKYKVFFTDWRLIDELSWYVPNESLIEKVVFAKKMVYEKYKKDYAKSAIIDGNYDIEANTLVDFIKSRKSCFNMISTKNGEICERLLFIDPYVDDNNYLDIFLRRELRHILTTSCQLLTNGVLRVKTGNQINDYYNDILIDSKLNFYNELQTQTEAIKETKEAYANDIYILSSKGSEFPKEIPSIYDKYLNSFSLLYSFLPEQAKKSQVELGNGNLYEVIDLNELEKCEELIKRNDMSYDSINFKWREVKKRKPKTKKEIILCEEVSNLSRVGYQFKENFYPLVIYLKDEQIEEFYNFKKSPESVSPTNQKLFAILDEYYSLIDNKYMYINPYNLRLKIAEGVIYITKFIDSTYQTRYVDYISEPKNQALDTPRIIFGEKPRYFFKKKDHYDDTIDNNAIGNDLMILSFSLIKDLNNI